MHTATALAHPNIAFIKYWGNCEAETHPGQWIGFNEHRRQRSAFFRFGAVIFRVEDTHGAAVFAPKLLIPIAIFAIFDQIWADAPWRGVGDFFKDHPREKQKQSVRATNEKSSN